MPRGARAADAVARAGGMTAGADPVGVNLAAPLVDGDEIAVPKVGEKLRKLHTARGTRRRHKSKQALSDASMASVDINSADAATLAQLPGIGQRLAERIVEYRRVNGAFASLDELADVAGMTDRRIDAIAPYLVTR